MARYPGFIGPTSTNRAPQADAERTINLYPELIDGGATGKVRAVLHGTPGLAVFLSLPTGPVRALWSQDGRCFAIGGARFYEVYPQHEYIIRGTVDMDGNPATISSSGTAGDQLFITSGGSGYIFTLSDNTFNAIDDADFPSPVKMGGFVDGYFVALKANSRQFYLSALLDGTSWDGLDVGEVNESSNNLQALVVAHRELWLMGSKSTEVWVNTGAGNFPFAPLSGAFIEHGTIAPWSAVVLDNSLLWLGGDEHGAGSVWRAQGYTPTRISSHAVETALNRLPRLSDAIGWAYQEEGHLFYCLYVPTAETTFVYDVATQLWHERAHWDPGLERWTPHLARNHTFCFHKHLVGDRQSGAIYHQSLEEYSDELVLVGSQSPQTTPAYPAPTGGASTLIDTTTGSSREGLASQTHYYKLVALFGSTESQPLVIGPVATTSTQKRIGLKWDAYPTSAIRGVSPTALKLYRADDATFTTNLAYCDLTKYPAPETPTGVNASTHGTPGTSSYTYAVKHWNALVGYSTLSSSDGVSDGPDTFTADDYVDLDWYEDAAIDTGFFQTASSGLDAWICSVVYGRTTTGTWLDLADGNARDLGDDVEKSSGPFTAPTVTANLPINARFFLDDWPGLADSAGVPWVGV